MTSNNAYIMLVAITKQTEKAIKVDYYGWIPKSQIKMVLRWAGYTYIIIPAWLKRKISSSNYAFGIAIFDYIGDFARYTPPGRYEVINFDDV